MAGNTRKATSQGAAIGRGDLDVQVPLANEFYEWLYRLFHEE